MKIDYISDLHLDFHIPVYLETWKSKTFAFLTSLLPEQKGEVLVVAGDLSHYNRQSFFILEFFSSVYDHVLFVLGNHDYYLIPGEQQIKYQQDSKKREADLLERIQAISNITHLSYFGQFTYKDVTFGGATSWYSLQTEKERNFFYNSLNDSRLIKGLDIAATHKIEMQAFESLDNVDVIITHVPPIKIDSHDYFGSSDCFLNELPSTSAKLYIFGHSHEQNVYEKKDATFCINALGYPRENLAPKIRSIFL